MDKPNPERRRLRLAPGGCAASPAHVCHSELDRPAGFQIVVGHMGQGRSIFYWCCRGDLARITADSFTQAVAAVLAQPILNGHQGLLPRGTDATGTNCIGEKRVLFAVDYSFVSGRRRADSFGSVGLPGAVSERIAHKNVETLLKIGQF